MTTYTCEYCERKKAEALAIFCMDYRFHDALHDYIKNTLGIKHYDRVAVAGAGKSLLETHHHPDYIVLKKQIDLSAKLHDIQKVIIVHHTDCGAYGGVKAFEDTEHEKTKHLHDMNNIAKVIQEEILPGIEIIQVFLNLNVEGNNKKIRAEVISK
ncbi:hypothetical protein KKH43_01035 [Patescibacteria group bacterium]|nr:hypothetical protein [Patescibacteria group bacterium]